MTEDKMVGWHHRLNGHEFEQTPGVVDRQGILVCYSPWNSLGQNTGMGSLSLLQGIFPTQGSSTGLSHCGQILYRLSRILANLAKSTLSELCCCC